MTTPPDADPEFERRDHRLALAEALILGVVIGAWGVLVTEVIVSCASWSTT